MSPDAIMRVRNSLLSGSGLEMHAVCCITAPTAPQFTSDMTRSIPGRFSELCGLAGIDNDIDQFSALHNGTKKAVTAREAKREEGRSLEMRRWHG